VARAYPLRDAEFRHHVHFSQAAMRDPSRSVSHFLARLSL